MVIWADSAKTSFMTPDELNHALDAMTEAASGNPDKLPGLITVESGHWISTLSAIRTTCSALHDGMRHRNIQVHVSSTLETKVLARAEAGERGAPYRDPTPPT